MSAPGGIPLRAAGVGIPRPFVFWLGIAAVSLGVAAHIPMFLDAEDMDYMLKDMPFDAEMIAAMAAIVVGIVMTAVGLAPRRRTDLERIPSVDVSVSESKVNFAHATLVAVLTVAVVIDAMKPATLAFVAPGMAEEYGLTSAANPNGGLPVALLPLAGASGMVSGALLWGHFADVIGRRAAILFSGVLFIGTAVCGAMPLYIVNLIMCFLMGVGVGGMIPITFALLAETIPARHRGFAMVMVGAAVAAAYALTSALSTWLVPDYSWRILFLIGLPTGVLFILLNRWVPESPRFLAGRGHEEEASAVLRRFGATMTIKPPGQRSTEAISDKWSQIVSSRYAGLTLAICLVAFSAGVLTFGFQLWAPSSLTDLGVPRADVDELIRNAAFIAIPVSAAVAPLYGYWSSKWTIISLAALVAVSLLVLAVGGESVASNRIALYVLVALPIAGASSLIMIVAAYSSEVYPTEIRARGAGAATSASRLGGVLLVLAVVFSIVTPSITAMSIVGAVALIIALATFLPNGVETRQRSLETITREELAAEVQPDPDPEPAIQPSAT